MPLDIKTTTEVSRNGAKFCSAKARIPCGLDEDEDDEAGVVVCCTSMTGRTFVMCVDQSMPQHDYYLLNGDGGDKCGYCDYTARSARSGDSGFVNHGHRSVDISASSSSRGVAFSTGNAIRTLSGRCYKKTRSIRRHQNWKYC